MQKKFNIFISLTFLLLFCTACGMERKQPTFEYMPGMMDQPSIKAQEEVMRTPPEGTVPQGFEPYREGSRNPYPLTRENLLKGKVAFETYCAVCHGPRGLGNGSIVPKFPRPPSLTSEKVMEWDDSQIFHAITMGQNLMPSYASQTTPQERWTIVQYIRALQRAEHPKESDLEMLRQKLKELKGESIP